MELVKNAMTYLIKPPRKLQGKAQHVSSGILIGVFFVAAAVAFAASPGDKLTAKGLEITPDVFVEQAGAGELETVKLFLAAGMDVDARECCAEPSLHHHDAEKARGYRTALIAAAESGHLVVVRLLLEHGAGVNARNNRYDSALRLASDGGHTDVVRLLLHRGADVNASTGRGTNPLISAAINGNVEIARLLISHEAQMNPALGTGGETPLHLAATFGYVELVRLLIRHKADVNALTKGWSIDTPLDKARDPEIIRLLRAAGGKKASELR